MNRIYVAFALLTLVLLSYGLYQGMHAAPTEQTMGEVQRIFYYHVPAAWVAFFFFFVNFAGSVRYLTAGSRLGEKAVSVGAGLALAAFVILPLALGGLGRVPLVLAGLGVAVWAVLYAARRLDQNGRDALAVSAAEVGVVFCTINLVTGPIWARPVWGIWWTWDARLTSTLVLWLIYVSYLLLRRYSASGQMRTMAAVLGIFGFLNVPFVYLSIRVFRTQHPQPVLAGGEEAGLHPDMAFALYANLAAFLAFAGLLLWTRYRLERVRQQVEEAHAARALAEPPAAGAAR